MNEFTEKPELPPIVLPATWTCPITGMVVPKDPVKNLAWRAKVLEEAESDLDLRVDLFTASSQSILFWINAFVFTLRVKETGLDGIERQADFSHVPFCTWVHIQDPHILRIEHAIDEGEELLTDKSRDMGATWDHLAVLVHRFLFRPDESHLMISEKEDRVDILDGNPINYPHGSLADPNTLFGKIDYILSRLPEWMLPRMGRKKLHLVNQDTQTRIDGESSGANVATSERRTSIFKDEFAKVANAESIKRSTRPVSACRLVNSTPNGPGTTFSQWRMSGQIPVFTMPWWEHPEKGQGRYVTQDALGRWKIRSPWYDHEATIMTPKEMATELDMDHVGSGNTFFETVAIETHKKLFARKPLNTFSLIWAEELTESQVADALVRADHKKVQRRAAKGPWRCWAALDEHGRLDQTRTYTIGIDISQGQGASNSVMSVMCDQTREKVAEYADANTPPYELAKQACAAGLWVGGKNKRPLIIWENNGTPGFDFGHQLVHTYRYPSIYFDRAAGTVGERVGKRYGWRSSPEKKANALGLLRRAYAHGGFTNHSSEALEEATTYIQYDGGQIGPAALLEESESARLTHGDRVIADMLCLIPHAPREQIEETPAGSKSLRTFGGRMKQWQEDKRAADKRRTFNFAEQDAT